MRNKKRTPTAGVITNNVKPVMMVALTPAELPPFHPERIPTSHCRLTPVRTLIIINSVAIVACLNPGVNMAVTTNSNSTTVGAGICLNLIAVVAGFNSNANMSVATTRSSAVIETGIGLNRIAIVTCFYAGLNITIAA